MPGIILYNFMVCMFMLMFITKVLFFSFSSFLGILKHFVSLLGISSWPSAWSRKWLRLRMWSHLPVLPMQHCSYYVRNRIGFSSGCPRSCRSVPLPPASSLMLMLMLLLLLHPLILWLRSWTKDVFGWTTTTTGGVEMAVAGPASGEPRSLSASWASPPPPVLCRRPPS